MLLRGITVVLLLLFSVSVVRADEEIDARREQRRREQMELLLQSLIKAKAKPEFTYATASTAPLRCAEIEHYLRTKVKMKAIVLELALIVESHDPKLTPTRVYRVKYEDIKGNEYTHDFILQQHGSEWRVYAHVPPVELPAPPPVEPPPATEPQFP